jgi:hypothetical protein
MLEGWGIQVTLVTHYLGNLYDPGQKNPGVTLSVTLTAKARSKAAPVTETLCLAMAFAILQINTERPSEIRASENRYLAILSYSKRFTGLCKVSIFFNICLFWDLHFARAVPSSTRLFN